MITYADFCRLRQLHDHDRLDAVQIAAEMGLHPQVSPGGSKPATEGRLVILHGEKTIAEHPRSYERRLDFELPAHAEPLLHQRLHAHQQRQLIRFLSLGPAAPAYHEGLRQRRHDTMVQIQRIVALSETHGADLIARLLEDLLELQAFSADYVANLATQRLRPRPERAALHLSRASDLLDLEIQPPDLSLYYGS